MFLISDPDWRIAGLLVACVAMWLCWAVLPFSLPLDVRSPLPAGGAQGHPPRAVCRLDRTSARRRTLPRPTSIFKVLLRLLELGVVLVVDRLLKLNRLAFGTSTARAKDGEWAGEFLIRQ